MKKVLMSFVLAMGQLAICNSEFVIRNSELSGHDCKHDEHKHGEHKHDERVCDGRHAGGRSVEVSEAVQKVMGLKTVRSEKRKLQATIALTGRYELTPDARRTLATPVAGRLTILVKPLARVKKGDAVFMVESPDLSASAREIAVLEKRLEVYKKIGTANAQLESELAVKKAERASRIGTAREENGVVTVCADSDGLIEAFPSESGAWVETGTSVVRLVKPESLRLKALAAASDVARLADGMAAIVDGVAGEVRVGIGDDTGLVPVYVTFPAGGIKARAGARATAACVVDETSVPVTAVPSRALVRIGLQATVFVKDEHDADRFIALPVTPGISAGGWTAVSGFPDDNDLEVVVSGAYELKLALPSGNSVPAGHFHADGKFHVGEH